MIRCDARDEEWLNTWLSQDWVWDSLIDDDTNPKIRNILGSMLLKNPSIYVLHPNENTIFISRPLFGELVRDVHICIAPAGRGEAGIKAGKECLRWIWEYTSCVKLVGFPPAFNKPVIHYALACGFKIEGSLSNSFVRNGIYFNRRILGIEKE